jgi:GT2 family glycosyltransferase
MTNLSPFVCAIVVNWNRWDDTATCIRSVLNMDYPSLHVILVDNGSTTGSPSLLDEFFPEIEILQNRDNLGFATAVNLGIARALALDARYVFALNNDAVVDGNCLSALVDFIETDPSIGMVGPKIFYMDRPDRIWFAGANRNPLTFSLLNFGRNTLNRSALDHPRAVTYLCAGAVLIRREVLETAGCFDPAYFMYYEDCEFCLHTLAAGYRLYFVPAAKVWHKVAASTDGEGSALELYYRTSSVFLFLWKNTAGIHRYLLLVMRIIYIFSKMAYHFISGSPAVSLAIWRGFLDSLSKIRRTKCASS